MDNLKRTDPEVYGFLANELDRQKNTLGMIASENYASRSVLEAQMSVMNNKYAEGYPGKRYYAGNQFIDRIESMAIDRAKKLFGAEHANVQTHAGSQANMAAYMAVLELKDKIMSLELAHGGHLTHGAPVNFSGRMFNFVHYRLDKETGALDYDEVRKRAIEEKPKILLCGYSAYPRTIDFKAFGEIAHEIGAIMLADIAHIAGLVAGKVHPNPFPHADIVTTTTHKTLRGPRGAIILSKEKYAKPIDKAVFPGMQGGPFEHAIASKAVCFREAMSPEFADYSKRIVDNAKALADGFMDLGYSLVTGGTDNHLILIDLSRNKDQKIFGKEAQDRLEKVGIICNRNLVPYDQRPPMDPSGIRLGTPCLTTRGMGKSEMKEVAGLIHRTWVAESESDYKKISSSVKELCSRFPLYKDFTMG